MDFECSLPHSLHPRAPGMSHIHRATTLGRPMPGTSPSHEETPPISHPPGEGEETSSTSGKPPKAVQGWPCSPWADSSHPGFPGRDTSPSQSEHWWHGTAASAHGHGDRAAAPALLGQPQLQNPCHDRGLWLESSILVQDVPIT